MKFSSKSLKVKKIKIGVLLTASTVFASFLSSLAYAEATGQANFSAEQKKQVEKIVHDYLVNSPEVLLEASTALQKKQQDVMQQQAQTAIQKNGNQLINDKLTTVGNLTGNVTLIEFFDYQCGHCKKMNIVMSDLIRKNKNLRVVYKEFPIFGKSSEIASRVALAAGMQGKYQVVHDALLAQEQHLTDAIVMDIAKEQSLDMAKLKIDMDSKVVTDNLEATRQLAEKLHLMGTPAFIILKTPNGKFKEGTAGAFVPGAASVETLQELIKKAE